MGTTAKLYTNNFTPNNNTLTVSDGKEKQKISGSYLEDGTVSFEIAYNTKCTLPEWSWTGKTGDGQTVSGTNSSYTYSSRITRTYYHLVTENTGNSFADFEENVRNAYLSKNGGLGFERCVMYLTGMGNIRDVIPFPRTVNNCEL